MPCQECGTTYEKDLHVVGVIDLTADDADISDLVLCFPCLREKGLFCDEHDVQKLIVLDSSVEDVPGYLTLMSSCLECNLREAETLSEEDTLRYKQALSDNCPTAFLDGLEIVGSVLIDKEVPERLRATFAIVVGARLFGITLDEAVTRLALNIGRLTTRH